MPTFPEQQALYFYKEMLSIPQLESPHKKTQQIMFKQLASLKRSCFLVAMITSFKDFFPSCC